MSLYLIVIDFECIFTPRERVVVQATTLQRGVELAMEYCEDCLNPPKVVSAREIGTPPATVGEPVECVVSE